MPCALPAQALEPGETTRLIVRNRPGLQAHKRQRLLDLRGARARREIAAIDTSVIEIPSDTAAETIAALEASGAFAFVEEDGVVQADAVVNDPLFHEQWGTLRINAAESWNMTMGSPVVVAVIDSGVEAAHPDLQGQLVPGWDFVNDDDDPADDGGHGTAMTGIIVAAADNGIGIAGVAPQAAVMPIKVLDQTGFGFFSNVAAGIVYAVDHGATVINLSLSAGSASPTLQTAVDYARAHDVVVVASAGNSAVTQPTYPAAIPGVVGVMATDSDDDRAWFSNYGPWVTLAAPGLNIHTTLYGGDYTSVLGTSPAAALASAAFALLRAANPTMTAADAIAAMTANADDIGPAGFDSEFGYGLVDIHAALAPGVASGTRDRTKPAVTLVTPRKGNLVDGLTPVDVAVSDNVGVTRVDLEIDGEIYATTDIGPFTFAWDTAGLAGGIHTVRATAYDAAGNRGRSALVRVYVTPGEGLLVTRAKIKPGSDSSSVRLKAIVRLPEGVTFDPESDGVNLACASASSMVLSMQIAAGAMEIRRSTAQFRGATDAPAGGDVRVQLKPNAVGGTYALQLTGRDLDIDLGSMEMDLVLDIGGASVSQPLLLRPLRGDLVVP